VMGKRHINELRMSDLILRTKKDRRK